MTPGARSLRAIIVVPAAAAGFEPALRATLAALGSVKPTIVAAAPALARLEAFRASASLVDARAFSLVEWHRAVRAEGADVLALDARVALLPGTLPALVKATEPFRIGAASAYSNAAELLVAFDAALDESGKPTPFTAALAAALERLDPARDVPIAVAEAACSFFKGDALCRIESLPEDASEALVARYSTAINKAGFWRVAASRALAPAHAGARVSALDTDPREPAVRARLAALRQIDDRRRAFFDVNAFARQLGLEPPRRARIGIDLTATPYHGTAMNGTRRVCYAVARIAVERLASRADVIVVLDERSEAERIGLQPGSFVEGWSAIPASYFDVVLRPTQFQSASSLLAALRASRALSFVLLDLIAYQIEEIRQDTASLVDYRFTTDLALEACRTCFVISESAKEEARLLLSGRPDLAAKLRVLPLCDLREAAPTPSPVPALAGRRFFLWMGNRYSFKNLDQVRHAYETFKARDPGAPDLALLGAASEGTSAVVPLSDVSDAELAWLYKNASACIYSSLYEGFGLPVLEAARSNAPLLVARTPTNREILGDDAAGFFTTSEELTRLLEEAARDPAPFRPAKLAAAFDLEAFAREIARELEDAIRAPGPRPTLSVDASTLLADPPRFVASVPDDRWTARVGRRLWRYPWLWRIAKFFFDAVRSLTGSAEPATVNGGVAGGPSASGMAVRSRGN